MSASLVIAVVGLALAIIDITGLAPRADKVLHSLMRSIVGALLWFLDKLGAAWRWVLIVSSMIIIVYLICSYFALVDKNSLDIIDVATTVAAQLIMTLCVLIIALTLFLMAARLVFHLLGMPKRGIVSSLGMVMAAVGLWLEITH